MSNTMSILLGVSMGAFYCYEIGSCVILTMGILFNRFVIMEL